MSDAIRENWFVILIAAVILGFLAYFIYDANRDNVSGKQSEGKDVIASLTDVDFTADELYAKGEQFDGSLLYNLYKNAVVSQSVETTSAMESDAKSMEKTIDSNVRSQNSDQYQQAIIAELASYGFNGYDQLYDYCLVNVKEKELDTQYIKEHFDSLKASLEEKNPRLVSQIVVAVADPENLTEDEQTRMDNIDKAIESGTFAEAATAFSEDTATADKEGFAGYIDADDSSSGSGIVSAEAVAAALELNEGETSDWIDVTDSSTQAAYKVKVYVDTTDLDTILSHEDETVVSELVYAVLSANEGLSMHIVQQAADKLNITFDDADTQARLEAYMESQKGEAEYE